MKTLELKAQDRTDLGKKATADLRRNDLVPCVLYGGEEVVHFAADVKEVSRFVYSPEVYFASIQIGGKQFKAVMREIQFHPVSDKITHIDFIEVVESKKIRMDLPVKVEGNSVGVRSGGRLAVNVRKVRVEALPKDMPDEVTIDISNLNIGDALRVADVQISGVTFLDASNVVIAAVRITRNTKSAQAAEAAAK